MAMFLINCKWHKILYGSGVNIVVGLLHIHSTYFIVSVNVQMVNCLPVWWEHDPLIVVG